MPEQLLTVLNLCLLGLLYLFFFRVLRAVWTEVREPAAVSAALAPTGRRGRKAARAAARGAAAPSAAAAPATLTELSADGPGPSYVLDADLTIGRAPTCSIQKPEDGYVSGVHARLAAHHGVWWLEDLGSTNGTFLNGEQVVEARQLSVGDRIVIGGSTWEVG
jgi:hypothetical protein